VVGCKEVSDYLDVLVERGQEEAVYGALLDFMSGDAAPAWDVIDLCNLPEASPTLARLPDLARARGYQVRVEVEDVCPILDLPLTWEEYLDSLDKKQRHEIRRKLRRAEQEADTRFVVVGRDHDLEGEVRAFIELHQKSRPDKSEFMEPRMQAFFVDIARVLYRCGWLDLVFVEMNGQKAAALFNFDYGDAFLVYNSGYDPRQFSHLSPGIIVTACTIQRAIALGRRTFDFLQGPEVYKYRFGAHDTRVYRLLLARPDIDLDQAWMAGQSNA
jgi:CelD/BcsL family acetyltransferase involved in cellulose biosynthesis